MRTSYCTPCFASRCSVVLRYMDRLCTYVLDCLCMYVLIAYFCLIRCLHVLHWLDTFVAVLCCRTPLISFLFKHHAPDTFPGSGLMALKIIAFLASWLRYHFTQVRLRLSQECYINMHEVGIIMLCDTCM